MKPNFIIDPSLLSAGLLGVAVSELAPGFRARVHTNLHGQPEYHYTVFYDGVYWYPLTQGNGTYIVQTLVEIEQDSARYTPVLSESVRLELANPDTVYLQSCVNMLWRPDMECIKIAVMLAASLNGDRAKFNAVWKYVVQNFTYDEELAAEIIRNGRKYNYIPDIERIFYSKKDICFGLTAILNSMLRSVGLPARMVHGASKQANGAYHAWSNVLIDGTWKLVDVSFDIAQKFKDVPMRFGPNYEVRFFY